MAKYYSLLQASYDSYKTYGAEKITCKYDYSKYCDGAERARCLRKTVFLCQSSQSCWRNSACWKCSFKLTSDSEKDPNTGIDIPQTQQCARQGQLNLYTSSYKSPRASTTIDLCSNVVMGSFTNTDYSNPSFQQPYFNRYRGSPCLGTSFASYKSKWQDGLKKQYEPFLENLSKGSSGACVAPMVVNKASDGPCAEGTLIPDGGLCTGQCAPGYVASPSTLQCNGGSFSLAAFSCVATTTTTTSTTFTTTTTTITTTTSTTSTLGPYRCTSGENKPCACNGTVIYGKKYVSGKPGHGALTTLQDILDTQKYKEKAANGSQLCGNGAMGGDPIWGYFKHCYCLPGGPTSQ